MTRTKLGLLGLCAVVLGLMAMSASSAQASLFNWVVLDKDGKAILDLLAKVEAEVDVLPRLLTHVVGLFVEIDCTTFVLENVNLEKEGKLSNGKVKFSGCKTYSLTAGGALESELACNPHSAGQPAGTIITNEGKGELLLHIPKGFTESELVTKIEPVVVGGPFVTVLTEGCALPESNPIRGKLFIKDCELMAQLHQVIHLIEANELTSLWIGADNEEHLLTTIDGSAYAFLGGDHLNRPWAAEHNLP